MRASLNFVYARMVREMTREERDNFDATLNSGVDDRSWARLQAAAFERLESGEFDHESGGEG